MKRKIFPAVLAFYMLIIVSGCSTQSQAPHGVPTADYDETQTVGTVSYMTSGEWDASDHSDEMSSITDYAMENDATLRVMYTPLDLSSFTDDELDEVLQGTLAALLEASGIEDFDEVSFSNRFGYGGYDYILRTTTPRSYRNRGAIFAQSDGLYAFMRIDEDGFTTNDSIESWCDDFLDHVTDFY